MPLEKIPRPRWRSIAALGLLLAVALATPAPAQDDDELTDEDRAVFYRELAEQNALARLGYPTAYPFAGPGYGPTGGYDFYGLTQQIQRLAAQVQALAAGQSVGQGFSGIPVPPDMLAGGAGVAPGVEAVYGPGGPSVRSVQLLLDYRLLVTGNPRLKAGEVIDKGDRIVAQVVTLEGALVDEFTIDKKTGVWIPVR